MVKGIVNTLKDKSSVKLVISRRFMARVLLAVPPGCEELEIYRVTGIKAPPLGLAWIASVLEGH
ncbi:MAG: hypothetical protein QXD12_02040, partial [Candidatus Nezhaarchaeales archaeon]